jgi:hypothetical protein
MPSLSGQLHTDGITQLWVIYHDDSGLGHAKTVPPERYADAVASGLGFAKANMAFCSSRNDVGRNVPWL